MSGFDQSSYYEINNFIDSKSNIEKPNSFSNNIFSCGFDELCEKKYERSFTDRLGDN